jgi:uroporphyrinogen-III decarboxylase
MMKHPKMQNSKEIFLSTLRREKTQRVPCAPHWWGVYKYELPGHDYSRDAWTDGENLYPVYVDFYNTFRPDWFHLHIGTPVYFRDAVIDRREGKSYLRIAERFRDVKGNDRYFSVNCSDDEEIIDFTDYLLGSRSSKPRVDLRNRRSIDEFIVRYVHMDCDAIISMGYTDHIPPIVRAYGDDVFIVVHIPSAICEIFDPTTGYTGFEEGLMALRDEPEGMRYLVERCYIEQLEWVKAYASVGVHGYCISESYISPDIAGPDVYRSCVKAVHREYFSEVRRLGLVPFCHFWGDVNPLLDDLCEIGIDGLLVEESKKTFTVDVCELSEIIGERLCLFGNLDSISLLHDGNPEEVKVEVLKQWGCVTGPFVAANGSPITPGTPAENLHALIQTVKEDTRT